MEWNAKPPSHWEWENLINFSGKPTENPKKFQSADWMIDEMRKADSGSFYLSGGGPGGSPGSDFGSTSTKSSKSASISSPSVGEAKPVRLSNFAAESILEGCCNKKEFAKTKQTGTFLNPDASLGSSDSLLSLKLGKVTDFGDASGRSSAKSSSFSVIPVPIVSPAKRLKSSSLSVNPRCQVEGCNHDLSSAKDYHRKHRVCESHSKCSKVIIGGLERRFCQQCSRFHSLVEFDENKRSCRKRLSDHNARRRKPQPEPMKLNSTSLYSSFSDVKRHISFGWNKGPSFLSKSSMNNVLGTTGNSVFMQTNEYMAKPVKMGSTSGQLNHSSNGRSNITTKMCHDSSGLYLSRCTSTEVPNQGLSVVSSNINSAQEFHSALSLLSNTSGGSCEPKHFLLDHAMNATPLNMHQPVVHMISPGSLTPLSDFWQYERPQPEVPAIASQNLCNSHYPELQQLRAPYESSSHSCQFG